MSVFDAGNMLVEQPPHLSKTNIHYRSKGKNPLFCDNPQPINKTPHNQSFSKKSQSTNKLRKPSTRNTPIPKLAKITVLGQITFNMGL